MAAPVTTRYRRKTRTRPHRQRRLPALGWGWALIALTLFGVAKTWPIYTGLTVALIALTAVLAVVRPRRLAPLLDRASTVAAAITARRNHLPAHGRRTLDAFQRMQPYEFERAIAALAREDRHRVTHAEQVGQANDRGADVIVQLRDGRRIMIQCKRYNGHNVGSEDVQKTNGTYRDIHGCHAAVIVTTADFTRDAEETNRLLGYRIRFVNGEALEQWANGGHAPW